MKKILIIFCITTLFSACKNDAKTADNSETTKAQSFNSMLNAYYEDGLVLNPISATQAGDNRYNDKNAQFFI